MRFRYAADHDHWHYACCRIALGDYNDPDVVRSLSTRDFHQSGKSFSDVISDAMSLPFSEQLLLLSDAVPQPLDLEQTCAWEPDWPCDAKAWGHDLLRATLPTIPPPQIQAAHLGTGGNAHDSESLSGHGTGSTGSARRIQPASKGCSGKSGCHSFAVSKSKGSGSMADTTNCCSEIGTDML